ncbi:MAG: hypothetical protein QOG67_1868 [Verrucomicrobiota bacterium]|jgi:hypothetical protein
MKSINVANLVIILGLALRSVVNVNAQEDQPSASQTDAAQSVDPNSQNPYGPYQFLVGDWNVASDENEPAVAVQRFRWGPNHSYIWFAGSLLFNDEEKPHFEGILMWNGVHKNLDMLVAMDLESGLVQEQGTVSIQSDGTVVREITATYSAGARPIGAPVAGPSGLVMHFRQTFKAIEPGKIVTTVMRQSDHGWVATFPGSDHMIMTRRPG